MNRFANFVLSKTMYYHPRLSYFDKGEIHYFLSKKNVPQLIGSLLVAVFAWKQSIKYMDQYMPLDKSLKADCNSFPFKIELQE